jgi:predicted O-methyltransferase YrrM
VNYLLQDIIRFPGRVVRGLRRLADPVYALQRRANREVRRWLSAARMAELDCISGTSSPREGRLLAYLVTQSPSGGCIVEIGAFRGKTTAWLVEAAQQRSDRPAVVSIDPHLDLCLAGRRLPSWEEFQRTVVRFALLQRGLEVCRAPSHDVGRTWDRPISFLWLDGSHEYADVVTDIDDFVPHVLPKGHIVFDDVHGTGCPGVWQAIAERLLGRPGFRRIGALKHFEIFETRMTGAPHSLTIGWHDYQPVT